MKKIYIIGGVLITISIGVYFLLTASDSQTKTTVEPAKTNDAGTSLLLNNQLVVTTVKIDEVKLTKPGFVVIREVIQGKLAQISEVSPLLPTGTSQNITVELLEIPRDEVSLIAVIYTDDGDGGFNPSLDTRAKVGSEIVARYIETAQKVPSSLFQEKRKEVTTEVGATIIYTDTGYSPNIITVEQGQTVSFVNDSSFLMWAASDPHPAHTILSSFDQFAGSEPGSTYQYTFDDIGTWEYHDHINPSMIGTVIVTEPKESLSLLNISTLPILDKNKAGYFETDVDTFSELAENPEVTMVNVHIPFFGKIPGTELSIPYNKTQELINSLPEDKNAPIALYCRGGGMSAVASKDLVAAGYTNIYDLNGGMNAYEKSGRELIKNN